MISNFVKECSFVKPFLEIVRLLCTLEIAFFHKMDGPQIGLMSIMGLIECQNDLVSR